MEPNGPRRHLPRRSPLSNILRCPNFDISMTNNRAIVFLTWGDKHIQLVADGIRESRLSRLPICLVTDSNVHVAKLSGNVDYCRISPDSPIKQKDRAVYRYPTRHRDGLFLELQSTVCERNGIIRYQWQPGEILADFIAV
jgi:hypothetical protein